MKFLLDQGLPRSAATLLRRAGHDALHVGEVGLHDAPDGEILSVAASSGQTVVTLDADFHMVLAVSGASRPSVIRLRMEGLLAEQTAEIIHSVAGQCAEGLLIGAVVTVTASEVRMRRLPIKPAQG